MRWPWKTGAGNTPATSGQCRTCTHFDNAPETLEAEFGNLASMSSGFASVRAEDGLCRARGIYLSARAGCTGHRTVAA